MQKTPEHRRKYIILCKQYRKGEVPSDGKTAMSEPEHNKTLISSNYQPEIGKCPANAQKAPMLQIRYPRSLLTKLPEPRQKPRSISVTS